VRGLVLVQGKAYPRTLDSLAPQHLVGYRSDAALQQDVYDALYAYPLLRIDLPGITLHVSAGVVWLRGHVSSASMRRLAADQLVEVAGITELQNELVADEELAAAVAMALARDARTTGQHIGVYPRLGVVQLCGNVRTRGAHVGATAVAATGPHVVRVENHLHLDPHGTVLPDLAGVTNEDDLVPGGR
jgi:osmotically-inducible protein OsmY